MWAYNTQRFLFFGCASTIMASRILRSLHYLNLPTLQVISGLLPEVQVISCIILTLMRYTTSRKTSPDTICQWQTDICMPQTECHEQISKIGQASSTIAMPTSQWRNTKLNQSVLSCIYCTCTVCVAKSLYLIRQHPWIFDVLAKHFHLVIDITKATDIASPL